MKFIFALKNRLVNSWTDPHFENVEPKDKARYLNNFCVLNPEEGLKNGLQNLDLFCLGKYDDEHGKFEIYPEPEFLADLSQPFEQLRLAKEKEGIPDGRQAN